MQYRQNGAQVKDIACKISPLLIESLLNWKLLVLHIEHGVVTSNHITMQSEMAFRLKDTNWQTYTNICSAETILCRVREMVYFLYAMVKILERKNVYSFLYYVFYFCWKRSKLRILLALFAIVQSNLVFLEMATQWSTTLLFSFMCSLYMLYMFI